MGSKGAPNAVAEISRLLGRAPLLRAAFKRGELEDDGVIARIGVFARAVERAQAAAPATALAAALTPSTP